MSNNIKTSPSTSIQPMVIDQAIIGLELGDTDFSILNYFNFFSRKITVKAAHFMHILPHFDLLTAFYEKETQTLMGQYTLNEDKAQHMREEVISLLTTGDKTKISYDIAEGTPLEELLIATHDIKADLVVIGQDRGPSDHGILAKNLARSCTVNTLVIPKGAKPNITTILVPIDFSESSEKALKTAIAIHKELKQSVRIICLNVYSMPNTQFFRNETPWLAIKNKVEKEIKAGLEVFINNIAGDYQKHLEADLVERQTTGTASYIVDYANSHGADFIVMGAKGHSKVHLLLMGSVTEGLLDFNTRIPTLVVK